MVATNFGIVGFVGLSYAANNAVIPTGLITLKELISHSTSRACIMNTNKPCNGTYDFSWDGDNEELFDEKYSEWERRNWESWLGENVTFPFEVKRVEDERGWSGAKSKELFGLGHIMNVLSIEKDDDLHGIIIKVRESGKLGYVPLCDVEVTSRADPNFWPVREYAVWFANS